MHLSGKLEKGTLCLENIFFPPQVRGEIMEFKLEGPWDKTPAHQVFIPVHKNNYFKVIKKKTLPVGSLKWNHMLLKQFERKRQTQGTTSRCVSSRASTDCLAQTRLWERLSPSNHISHQRAHGPSVKSTGLSGIWGGSLSLLHPHPKNFNFISASFNAALQILSPGHCPLLPFLCCP